MQLQSSAVAYKDGISGPWWYGSGATVQVLLFAQVRHLLSLCQRDNLINHTPQLAAKLKLNAPHAHTWLEIVAARWGTVAHLVFMFFGLATNVIVSSMLILGGSATVTSLTGMNTIAVSNHAIRSGQYGLIDVTRQACFLIPLGVAIYVVVGGMRATLLCD